jgi:hypothetical protein
MGDVIPEACCRNAAGPVRIGAAQGRCRTRVRIKSQDHQRWRAPFCPAAETGCSTPVTGEPGHRGARDSGAIIARTGDHGNRHRAGDPAPVFPAVKLGQVVRSHQPDEPPFGPAPDQRGKSIGGEPGAKFSLHHRYPDRGTAGLLCGRAEPGRQRRHPSGRFQRISGGNQPPRLVQRQSANRLCRNAAVAAVGGVEAAPQQAGIKGLAGLDGRPRIPTDGSDRCRAPAIYTSSALPAPRDRARGAGRWQCRFRRQGRIRRHRRTGWRR